MMNEMMDGGDDNNRDDSEVDTNGMMVENETIQQMEDRGMVGLTENTIDNDNNGDNGEEAMMW